MRPSALRSPQRAHLHQVEAEPATGDVKPASANRTLTTDLFDRLRTDILHCRLRPNSRLRFRDLREAYSSGISPLREALMRLASDGLVVLEDHKGFRVAPVSREELVDIANTRCELEGAALRLSIEKGDDAWEANIVGRFHEMSKRTTYTAEGTLDTEWERRHDAFHRSLYAGCGLRWMTNFCELLAERAYRYRHLLLEHGDRTRDLRSEHEQIMRPVLDRRANEGVEMLQNHYRRTVNSLVEHWPELE
jgi:GntR family transcriptional regulator, carbon starvation induced regulator